MSKILCKPCLAFEALAALVFCNNDCRNDIPKVKEWVEQTFKGINIGASDQFFKILPVHYSFEEIETFNVKKLAEVYPSHIRDLPYVAQYEADLINGKMIYFR